MSNTNGIGLGFAIGVFFAGAVFGIANHNKTYSIVISEPVTAQLDLRDWRMDKLKESM